MARKLMPDSGIMMPYIVASRDAQISGVSYVDGQAGNVDLSGKYLQIVDAQTTYALQNHSYSKTESDGRYLQSHNVIVGYNQPIKAKGIPTPPDEDVQLDLIQASDLSVYVRNPGATDYTLTQTKNAVVVGDLNSNVQGVHIKSEGRAGIIYTDTDTQGNPQIREAPLYSRRFPPEIQDVPFAVAGEYITDATTGRVTGVRRTGINSDIKELAGDPTDGLKVSAATTFDKPIKGQQATADNELVTRSQAITIANAAAGGGGGSSNAATILANFIGSVEWWQGSPDAIPKGYIAADGQLVKRADYPELWTAVKSKIVTLIGSADGSLGKDSNWVGVRSGRGTYSFGKKVAGNNHAASNDADDTDASGDNFRVPDLNGKQTAASLGVAEGSGGSSIKGLFLRGSGMAGVNNNESGSGPGVVRDSAIPNVTGSTDGNTDFGPLAANKGAIQTGNVSTVNMATAGAGASSHAFNFDAARSKGGGGIGQADANGNPTGPSVFRNGTTEIRPNSVQGTWIIRASGAFDSSNTSVAIVRNDTTAPTSGVQGGGHLSSRYQIAGKDFSASAFETRWTPGQLHSYTALVTNRSDPNGFIEGSDYLFGSDGSFTLPNNSILATPSGNTGSLRVTGGFNVSGGFSAGAVTTPTINASGSVNAGSIEIMPPTGGSGQAFIDFHHNRAAADYSARIITNGQGLEMAGGDFLAINGRVGGQGGLRCKAGYAGGFANNGFNAEWNTSSQMYLWIDNSPQCGWYGGQWQAASDKELKEDISYQTDADKALDEVIQWKPAVFSYKARGVIKKGAPQLGFIANDLVKVSPDVVNGEGLEEGADIEKGNPLEKAYSLDQMAIIAKMAQAIQALEKRVAELESKQE